MLKLCNNVPVDIFEKKVKNLGLVERAGENDSNPDGSLVLPVSLDAQEAFDSGNIAREDIFKEITVLVSNQSKASEEDEGCPGSVQLKKN